LKILYSNFGPNQRGNNLAGPLEINHLKTLENKPFTLLNLPYFLAGQLKEYLGLLIEEEGRGIKGA